MDKLEELEKENQELKAEIIKLQGIIDYLRNPMPYELSVKLQRQQVEAERHWQKQESELRARYGLGRRW